MGPLYRNVLEEAARLRDERKIERRGRKLRHLERFLDSMERERWYRERQGTCPR